jgi:hypothetical protein
MATKNALVSDVSLAVGRWQWLTSQSPTRLVLSQRIKFFQDWLRHGSSGIGKATNPPSNPIPGFPLPFDQSHLTSSYDHAKPQRTPLGLLAIPSASAATTAVSNWSPNRRFSEVCSPLHSSRRYDLGAPIDVIAWAARFMRLNPSLGT